MFVRDRIVFQLKVDAIDAASSWGTIVSQWQVGLLGNNSHSGDYRVVINVCHLYVCATLDITFMGYEVNGELKTHLSNSQLLLLGTSVTRRGMAYLGCKSPGCRCLGTFACIQS